MAPCKIALGAVNPADQTQLGSEACGLGRLVSVSSWHQWPYPLKTTYSSDVIGSNAAGTPP